MLNKIAHQNPSTAKPGTTFDVNNISNALITNVNSPRVKILIGSVKIMIIGFKKAFIIPRTSATTSAVRKSEICTPGNKYAEDKTANVAIIQLINNFTLINVFSY